MKSQLFRLLFLSTFLLFFNCQDTPTNPPTIIHPGFYYWQTNFDLNTKEYTYINVLATERIYIKFFDIDWDFNRQQAIPHASLQISTAVDDSIQIIPTIFITNRTFKNISPTQIEPLKNNVLQKLEEQLTGFPNHPIKMLQIDCDWSVATKDNYFTFLHLLKEQLAEKEILLSTTIRLHQIKYPKKTGVPPVKRGLLMFYNMGAVKNIDTENSILDLAIAKKYTDAIPYYPLPLDLGLPLFQWGVLFRKGKMIQLINQLSAEKLADTQRFIATSPNHWRVLKDTYLDGLFLYQEDVIRLEATTIEQLRETVLLLKPYFTGKEFDLLFYHLEEEVLSFFEVAEIEEIIHSFRE